MTITKDILQDGKLSVIEFYDEAGNFKFQAVWDPRDEHTPEKVTAFRKWADTMATRLTTTKE